MRQDYLFRYKAAVEAVTPEDVLAAAQRRLHPRSQVPLVPMYQDLGFHDGCPQPCMKAHCSPACTRHMSTVGSLQPTM